MASERSQGRDGQPLKLFSQPFYSFGIRSPVQFAFALSPLPVCDYRINRKKKKDHKITKRYPVTFYGAFSVMLTYGKNGRCRILPECPSIFLDGSQCSPVAKLCQLPCRSNGDVSVSPFQGEGDQLCRCAELYFFYGKSLRVERRTRLRLLCFPTDARKKDAVISGITMSAAFAVQLRIEYFTVTFQFYSYKNEQHLLP